MPPITAEGTSGHISRPNIVWSVHASYALIKDIDKAHDDVDDDDLYFVTSLLNGESMATEWNPELRLGIVRAIDSIPHVYRQEWHYIGLESADKVLDEILALEQDHDFLGRPVHRRQTLFKCGNQPNNNNNNNNNEHIPLQRRRRHNCEIDDNTLIKTVVLNFTDGMEVDGWPGISVVRGLEKRQLAFTGANSELYYLDSDKALIKRHLVESGTPTPGYCDVYSRRLDDKVEGHGERETATHRGEKQENREEDENLVNKAAVLEQLAKLKFPLLVKPANSSSSRGISVTSVVDTPEEAYERAIETKKIWGPVYVEEYISGREYTALVSGSQETGIRVYKVLERIFRSQIPERERMLTHEMKWGDNKYGSDETVQTASWWMQICSEADQDRLQPLAESIYASFGGNGYCRMDLREDHRTGDVFVVDVNANCAIDEDPDCAMGKILKASNLTLGQFFSILMDDAIQLWDNLVAKSISDHADLKALAAAAMTASAKHALTTPMVSDRTGKAVRVGA